MKKISRGFSPGDYNDYKKYKTALVEQLGFVCAYCEAPIANQPDIEHIFPKGNPNYVNFVNDWENLLLACKRCNQLKSDKDPIRYRPLFPDYHDLSFLYDISEAGMSIRSDLTTSQQQCAEYFNQLLGFSINFDSSGRIDDRQQIRQQKYQQIMRAKQIYLEADCCSQMIPLIVNQVDAFFTIWLTLFHDYPEVCEAILIYIKDKYNRY